MIAHDLKKLTDDDARRYARHLSLPEIGMEGQRRLKSGSVLVIGAGGLGSPVLLYLAAAGVGCIGVADGDRVDDSNLQRQVIHTTDGVGRLKVESAAERMKALNPDLQVDTYAEFVDADKLVRLIESYDFVIDATDSLDAKLFIDRVCVDCNKPYNHGAIRRFEGQTMTVVDGSTSLNQLFADPKPETGGPVGPLGVVPGILGTIQATEAIKYLTGVGQLLTDRLLRFDVRTMQFDEIRLR